MPEFSIVVPTHDRPQYLAEAIESVLTQTYDDFECIIVDDASAVVPELPSDQRFRLVRRTEVGGPAAATNTGLRTASGKYVIRLDDDDLFTPDRLELAREGLSRAPVAICWTRTLGDPASRSPAGRRLDGNVADTILDSTTPHMGATAARLEVFLELDEQYLGAADVEWWLRMSLLSDVATVPKVGHLYRRHDTPRTIHGTDARVEGSMRLLREHADYFAEHPRAAAFRWRRIGIMQRSLGRRRESREAFLRSFRVRPSIRTAKHLIGPR